MGRGAVSVLPIERYSLIAIDECVAGYQCVGHFSGKRIVAIGRIHDRRTSTSEERVSNDLVVMRHASIISPARFGYNRY